VRVCVCVCVCVCVSLSLSQAQFGINQAVYVTTDMESTSVKLFISLRKVLNVSGPILTKFTLIGQLF
jgi:hypothetical protein